MSKSELSVLDKAQFLLVALVATGPLIAPTAASYSWLAFILTLSVLFLIMVEFCQRKATPISTDFLFAALLVGYMGLSSLWGDMSTPTWKSLRDVLNLLAFLYILSRFVQHRNFIVPLFWLFAIAGSASAVLAICGYFVAAIEFPRSMPRLQGPGLITNPVLAAMAYGCCTVFTFALAFLHTATSVSRVMATVCLVVLLIALWLTGSTGPQVATLICVYCIWGATVGGKKPLYAAVALGSGFIILIVSSGQYLQILPRLDIWQHVFEQTMLLPFGLGLGSTVDLSVKGQLYEHPHSIYLSAFAFGGPIAFAGLILLLGRQVLRSLKSKETLDKGTGLGIIIYPIIVGLFDGGVFVSKPAILWSILWVPLFIVSSRRPVSSNLTPTKRHKFKFFIPIAVFGVLLSYLSLPTPETLEETSEVYGSVCTNDSTCSDGSCEVGPDNLSFYCAAPGKQCGFPNSNGFKHGQTVTLAQGALVQCFSQIKGRSWRTFNVNELAENGDYCVSDEDCSSAFCREGPEGHTYCKHAGKNCAAPRSPGLMYSQTIEFDGATYQCYYGRSKRGTYRKLE